MALLFLLWLCSSAVLDAKYRKCYNWLVLCGIIFGVISLTLIPDSHPVNISILDGVIAAFLAFSVLLIFYTRGMVGGGDVKFAAALGVWLGWQLLLPVWALSCAFAVAHGLIVSSNLKYFFPIWIKKNIDSEIKCKKFIPYVTYLSLATIIVLLLNK